MNLFVLDRHQQHPLHTILRDRHSNIDRIIVDPFANELNDLRSVLDDTPIIGINLFIGLGIIPVVIVFENVVPAHLINTDSEDALKVRVDSLTVVEEATGNEFVDEECCRVPKVED